LLRPETLRRLDDRPDHFCTVSALVESYPIDCAMVRTQKNDRMKISASYWLSALLPGWLAGQIVRGTGLGLLGDLVVGIAGAFLASWIFPQLGIHLGSGIVAEILEAAIGAILLLVIIRLVRGRSR
jgi:uncharacterized membrane protein YeaQ/YmgE (transglycosylase-associated protein family)